MEQISVNIPNQDVMISNVNPYLLAVESLVIDSDDMYSEASAELEPIKAKIKELEATRVSLVNPLNDTVKRINNLFKKPISICEQAESAIKQKMIAWVQHKDKLAREEQARIEREQAAIRQAAIEEERRLMLEAERLAAEGKTEEAEQAKQEATLAIVQTAVIEPVASVKDQLKGTGASISRPWTAEVTDKMAFIKYVAAHPEFEHLLSVDVGGLKKLAKAMKENLKMDGIRAFEDIAISKR
jgi:hypothetical protein